jgi:uncharacterized repeat protein (TIGR01451 family)
VNDAADGWPSWSPDGARIAFSSRRDGNDELYVMNADGSGQTRLTSDPARDERPAWSPDGAKIVFESTRDPRVFDRDVFVMNADGSGVRRLRTGLENGRDADWQPTVDLAVAQAAQPARPVVGRRLVYRLAVHNRSHIAATAVALRDVLPAGARLLSARPSQGRCSLGRTVTCRLGVLSAGVKATIVLAVRPTRPGALRNVAVVGGAQADADEANNQAALRTRVAGRPQPVPRPRG